MLNINNKSWLERLHGMQEVVGSTPISSTTVSTQNLLISRGFVVCGGGGVKYIGSAEEVRTLQVKHITFLKREPYKEEIRQILEAVRTNQFLPTY